MSDLAPQTASKAIQNWLAVVLAITFATGILLPSILYGVLLRPRQPVDVLVSCGLSVFASIVYLWTLHAISVITLRDRWMSHAIFTAAIAGVLGASVTIYQKFGGTSYPMEGTWEFRLQRKVDGNIQCIWYGNLMFVNSPSNRFYIGLAGDGRDHNDSVELCPYGVKNLTSIEWNDPKKEFTFLIENFSVSQNHPIDKNSPSTPLHFALKESGDDWVSEITDENSSAAGFRMVLHRQ